MNEFSNGGRDSMRRKIPRIVREEAATLVTMLKSNKKVVQLYNCFLKGINYSIHYYIYSKDRDYLWKVDYSVNNRHLCLKSD